MNENYFNEYLFKGDPFPTKVNDGVWCDKRDIILGLNIPDYR